MRNKVGNYLWGLFFIVIGLSIAGRVLWDWDFNLWFDGWWTLFIIIPCLISMLQNGFGTASTMGFIIGVMLLLQQQDVFDIEIGKLIVPVILIFIGLRTMFPGSFHRRHIHQDNSNFNSEGFSGSSMGGSTSGNFTGSSQAKQEYSAIFSSNHIHLRNEHFMGTSLNAVFGSIVLDLRDTVIDHDVEINASAIFGGIDIYIPRGVQVKTNNVPIFGGVSNKTDHYVDPNAPTIYINSTCMFGGIDIK